MTLCPPQTQSLSKTYICSHSFPAHWPLLVPQLTPIGEPPERAMSSEESICVNGSNNVSSHKVRYLMPSHSRPSPALP